MKFEINMKIGGSVNKKIIELVKGIQTEINAQGFTPKLKVDGIFGPKTDAALKAIMYAEPLPVKLPDGADGPFTRAKLATLAEQICAQKIKEGTPGHKEIIADFIPTFGSGNWAWCSACVRYLCKKAGLNMPIKCPSKFGYTFAFVEGFQQWAIEKGFYHDNDGKFSPEAGDITIFDWDQKDISLPDNDRDNHIGIHLRMNGKYYACAEGNTSNRTDIKDRTSQNIQGWVRIPNGYLF